MLTSDLYRGFYQKYNQERKNTTSLTREDLWCIKGLVVGTRSKTILDYGSGQGEQYSKDKIYRTMDIESNNVSCYDIGVPEFSNLPDGPFDGVICSDVLEHIPEEFLDSNLQSIFQRATKFVFCVVHCGLAQTILPNGENAHCTIKKPSWWHHKLSSHNVNDIPLCIIYRIPTNPKNDILGLLDA